MVCQIKLRFYYYPSVRYETEAIIKEYSQLLSMSCHDVPSNWIKGYIHLSFLENNLEQSLGVCMCSQRVYVTLMGTTMDEGLSNKPYNNRKGRLKRVVSECKWEGSLKDEVSRQRVIMKREGYKDVSQKRERGVEYLIRFRIRGTLWRIFNFYYY